MADIKNVKVGAIEPDSIMFDNYGVSPSDFKFDFRNWIVNQEAGHDIEVTNNRIIIKKFKPNVWIIHSEKVTGSQNHAICAYCQGIYMTSKYISNYSNIFSTEQPFDNNHGAGNDKPKFRGLCIYPISTDFHWMQERMYTWESCWDTANTRNSPSVADWAAFRLGAGGHGTYGIWSDFTNKLMFPSTLYDFNSYGRNPNNNVDWYYGIMLATAIIQNFDDGSWNIANKATRNGKIITITTRLADNSNSYHVVRWNTLKTCKIKVTGLQPNDRLEYGAGNSVIASSDKSITSDGIYNITSFGNGNTGAAFKLYGNTETTSPVTIELINETYPNGIIDISSNPIIIEAEPIKGVDITNIECYDAYVGNTHVYHKDKTFKNCWLKYGLVRPYGFIYDAQNFTKNKFIRWIAANKFVIDNVNSEGINIINDSYKFYSNYEKMTYPAVNITVINKPDNVTIKFKRVIINSTNDAENSVDITLNNGINKIPKYVKVIYKNDTSEYCQCIQCRFEVIGEAKNINCIIKFESTYEDVNIFTVSTLMWENIVPKMKIPIISDIESYIPRVRFQMKPTNIEVWDRIKKWYEENNIDTLFSIGNIFNNSSGLKDITIKLGGGQFQYGEDNFAHSDIETITFKKSYNTACISSPQRLLRGAMNLKTINLVFDESVTETNKYICGATSIVDGMSNKLETYPDRFINWGVYRNHIVQNTVWCTLFHYAFNGNDKLIRIPDYPGTEDENTIVTAGAINNSFYNCSNLIYVGPTLDLRVCSPNSSNDAFKNCIKLQTIKIKNLNHGDWIFDGQPRNGYSNGILPNLNIASIKYLFDNLKDLTTHNPKKHEDTIENSFKNWTSDYFNAINETYDWEYTLDFITAFKCRKRYTLANAPFIVSTTAQLNNLTIFIEGLKSNEYIYFIKEGEVDGVQYGNGRHIINKNDNFRAGFKLIGDNLNETSKVMITIIDGLDFTNPKVSSANLYCPETWRDKITDEMVTNANTKGWTIYIGNVIKTV